jgi:sarcosine dehydrogenase
MQDRAEIVIIGGGALGCSIAYHLAKLGKKEIVVLEKSALTHGCTWHAAGLIGQLRNKRNLTQMLQYSARLYDRLEKETGQATGWNKVGSLRIASSKERWQEIKRTATTARSFGFELHLVSAKEAQEKFPLMTTDGVEGAAWIPSDGYVDPSMLTQALAKGARNGGVAFHEGIRVKELIKRDQRITTVVTNQGNIEAEIVVNAAGLWAREVGRMAGVDIPAGVVEHQYMVTEKHDSISANFPTFRDPDNLFYLKAEPGALALGGWEPDTVPCGKPGMSWSFGQQLYEPNYDRFEQIAVPAMRRLPILEELGVRTLINGPIPVSPDGEPIMGRPKGLDNFFVACGFTAGIAGCGGAGRALAHWIVEGDPGMDLWSFDVRRFGRHHNSNHFLRARTVEAYGNYYLMHYPGDEAHSARGIRKSPLYKTLKDKGAVYGSKFGWERPNWYALDDVDSIDEPSFESPNWFDAVAKEHRAIRERVALIDQSSFAKFEISGPGALGFMQKLSVNNVDRPAGSIIYAQLCNSSGGIEADVTITRLGEQLFYLVTGSGFGVHDSGWIESHLPRNGSVEFQEVTGAKAVINLCGPRSREVLELVCEEQVDNSNFAFMQARSLTIEAATLLALRATYVGELGYELHIPVEFAIHVYQKLWEAGQPFNIVNAGYRAIDSLRMEKGFVYWSADITPDYNPYEAGLGFCVDLDKGDFIGRDALKKIRATSVEKKLCCLTLAEKTPVFGGEAILHKGEVVGVSTSGNFGHTVGKNIVFAYLPTALLKEQDFEVEAFCEPVKATLAPRVLYDPKRERLLN